MVKSLRNNPVKPDYYDHRYDKLLPEYGRDALTFYGKVLNQAKEKFNRLYNPPRIGKDGQTRFATQSYLMYPNKFVPYLDLIFIYEFIHNLYYHRSQFPAWHNEEEDYKIPNTLMGQALIKYLKRRDPFSYDLINTKKITPVTLKRIIDRLETFARSMEHWFEQMSVSGYQELTKVDFNKRSISDLFDRLGVIHNNIQEKIFKKEALELKEKQTPSVPFLKFEDGFKWVYIECDNNRDDIEAKLMGHCATVEWDGAKLISLRDKEGFPVVTATVYPVGKFFILGQIKGKGNRKPPKKYYKYLFKLFHWNGIIYQKNQDNEDFTIYDLEDGDSELLLASKPYFENLYKLKDYVTEKEWDDVLTSIFSGAIISKDGSLMQSGYTKIKDSIGDNWIIEKIVEGFVDVDYSLSLKEKVDFFMEEILGSKKYSDAGRKLIKEVIKLHPDLKGETERETIENIIYEWKDCGVSADLENAIYSSHNDGWSVGSLSSLENAIPQILKYYKQELPKGISINRDGDHIDSNVIIEASDQFLKWFFTHEYDEYRDPSIDFDDLIENLVNSASEVVERRVNNMRIEYDFDSSVAAERLHEEILNLLDIIKKEGAKKKTDSTSD